MNLEQIIDQFIGEEKNITDLKKSIVKDFDVVIDAYQNFGYNQALQDLKSRKQELREGIVKLMNYDEITNIFKRNKIK